MQEPSGKALQDYALIDLVYQMDKVGFVRRQDEPFTLHSGILSRVKIFGREETTDNPEFGLQLGRHVVRSIQQLQSPAKRKCLIGVPTTGTTLATMAATIGCADGWHAISFRVLREVLKEHDGRRSWINGAPAPDTTYVIVDNALTTGRSVIEASHRLAEDGYPATPPVLVVVDREQGGRQELERRGHQVYSLMTLLEMATILYNLGRWPKSAVDQVIGEIDSHEML